MVRQGISPLRPPLFAASAAFLMGHIQHCGESLLYAKLPRADWHVSVKGFGYHSHQRFTIQTVSSEAQRKRPKQKRQHRISKAAVNTQDCTIISERRSSSASMALYVIVIRFPRQATLPDSFGGKYSLPGQTLEQRVSYQYPLKGPLSSCQPRKPKVLQNLDLKRGLSCNPSLRSYDSPPRVVR